MTLGPIPDYLKPGIRQRFLSGLKNSRSLDTYELDLFQWYRTETEETWANMDSEEQRYIQEQIRSGAEDINDSGVLAVDYYRRRMRSSHVIFLASLLEGAMKRECDRIVLALGEQILFKPPELKGDAWGTRRVFLERYGSFHISTDRWDPIKNLLAIRNALVHHSGDVSLLTQEQIATLGTIPGVNVDRSEIGIDLDYVGRAAQAVRELMEFIHTNTNSLIDRAMRPEPIK